MAVAANADDYTVGRLNIFFPAHNNTPLDGNLTGQCVTLVKWFMAEMTSVPSPFSARGHGRYVGKTLVAQGHAVEVPYSQRKRGDIICYEYGEYGHIAVQLSGGRVFEQNVNLGGVQRKLVDGAWVYASRIGSETESWRRDAHVYRLKSYNEQGDPSMQPATYEQANIYAQSLLFRDMPEEEFNKYHKGKTTNQLFDSFRVAGERKERLASIGQAANIVGALKTYDDLGAKVKALAEKPSGNVPVGTYLKINKADVIDVK